MAGDGALGGDDSGDAEDVVDGTCVLWGDHPVMLHERPVYLEGDE